MIDELKRILGLGDAIKKAELKTAALQADYQLRAQQAFFEKERRRLDSPLYRALHKENEDEKTQR